MMAVKCNVLMRGIGISNGEMGTAARAEGIFKWTEVAANVRLPAEGGTGRERRTHKIGLLEI
jgi:hypothetical protein